MRMVLAMGLGTFAARCEQLEEYILTVSVSTIQMSGPVLVLHGIFRWLLCCGTASSPFARCDENGYCDGSGCDYNDGCDYRSVTVISRQTLCDWNSVGLEVAWLQVID